jgi:hypothetical protein
MVLEGEFHAHPFIFFFKARKNLSKAATGRKLSYETKRKISESRRGIVISNKTREKIQAATTAIHGVAVVVKNIKTGKTSEYLTMTEAGKFLNKSQRKSTFFLYFYKKYI